MSQTTADSVVTFGIGCFAFEFANPSEGPFTMGYWQAEVEKALLSMANVSNVSVELDSQTTPSEAEWPVVAPQQGAGRPMLRYFHPTPSMGTVSFEISIASRLHPDLLDGQTLPCERFAVVISFEWDGPCTFVTCLEGDGEADGAHAVRLLWRFFRREFTKHTNTIEFTLLGPSPFHARFEVAVDSTVETVAWESLGVRGYDQIRFRVNPALCGGDVASATRLVHSRLADEAALYYSIIRDKNYLQEYSVYLRTKTVELVEAHQRRGLRATFGRLFKSGARARALGLEAMNHQLALRNALAADRDSAKGTYSNTETFSTLRGPVDEELDRLSETSFDNALEVVRFLETSRTKEMEVAVVASSTLLGGIAGTVAAVFLA